MGAWGHGVWENDSVNDWRASVEDVIAERIRERLTPSTREHEYDEVIGAADLLDSLTPEKQPGFPSSEKVPASKRWGRAVKDVPLELSYHAIEQRLFSRAVEALEGIIEDDEYLSRWSDPQARRDAIDALMHNLARKVEWETR